MIYTDLTNKALKIAYAAHDGQTDKAGMPYIFHPYHLAEQMDDEISVCVALLHDVAEDTDVTLDALAEIFPQEVMEPLILLSHKKGDDYLEYVKALKQNPIAKKVKLADLAHNSDQSRFSGIPGISEEMLVYFRKKYAGAKAIPEE